MKEKRVSNWELAQNPKRSKTQECDRKRWEKHTKG
jgi:hypothetical protein